MSFTEYGGCQYIGTAENPYHILLCAIDDSISSTEIHEDTVVIASFAFGWCHALTDIVIPNSVEYICNYAFSHRREVVSLTLGDGVKVIGEGAFEACQKLSGLVIPDSVEAILNSAFRFCSELVDIDFGSGLVSIGEYAFDGCKKLQSLEFNDGLKSIGREAFKNCTALEYVFIPKSVTRIELWAFIGCTQLTIYCEAEALPEGWESYWEYCSDNISGTGFCAVHWRATRPTF